MRYEYKVKEFTGTEDAVEYLNEMAAEGWEYVEGLYEGHPPLDVLFRRVVKKSPAKARSKAPPRPKSPTRKSVARGAKQSTVDS